MRVLDLDLDFFLDGARYVPSTAESVASFLERQCGLSVLLLAGSDRQGRLTTPFDVVHVDAHADLGLGDTGYRYIMCELLHLPALERTHPNAAQVMEGNSLAFAAACRWLDSVTYVKHPARQHDDRPFEHFLKNDAQSGFLQLKCCDPTQFATDAAHGAIGPSVVAFEPSIPFRTVEADALVPLIETYVDSW